MDRIIGIGGTKILGVLYDEKGNELGGPRRKPKPRKVRKWSWTRYFR